MTPPAKPRQPEDPKSSKDRPACLFNGMIAPLIPYGIRGVATYPGLGNLYWAEHSVPLLSTMIRDWHARWGQGPFPIGMVQPAPFPCDRWPKRRKDAYSLQRESQLLILDEFPNIGLATTTDLGDLEEIHFTNKQEVGRRLALWALAKTYGQPGIVYSGPVYHSMRVEDGRVRLFFESLGGGLASRDGKALTDFSIAGGDKKFVEATAVIDGDSVVVSSPEVPRPVAVRFGWHQEAEPNLSNAAGLPASPFRTDRW